MSSATTTSSSTLMTSLTDSDYVSNLAFANGFVWTAPPLIRFAEEPLGSTLGGCIGGTICWVGSKIVTAIVPDFVKPILGLALIGSTALQIVQRSYPRQRGFNKYF